MRGWARVKHALEARLAPELNGRLQFWATRYRVPLSPSPSPSPSSPSPSPSTSGGGGGPRQVDRGPASASATHYDGHEEGRPPPSPPRPHARPWSGRLRELPRLGPHHPLQHHRGGGFLPMAQQGLLAADGVVEEEEEAFHADCVRTGKFWITLDGAEKLNVVFLEPLGAEPGGKARLDLNVLSTYDLPSAPSGRSPFAGPPLGSVSTRGSGLFTDLYPPPLSGRSKIKGVVYRGAEADFHEVGIYNQADWQEALAGYLALPLKDILQARNPLVRGLALLDRRIPRSVAHRISAGERHPLVNCCYALRIEHEGASVWGPRPHDLVDAAPSHGT